MRRFLFITLLLGTTLTYAETVGYFQAESEETPFRILNNMYINDMMYPFSLEGVEMYQKFLKAEDPALYDKLNPMVFELNKKKTFRRLSSSGLFLLSLAAGSYGIYTLSSQVTGNGTEGGFFNESVKGLGFLTLSSAGFTLSGILLLSSFPSRGELMDYVEQHNLYSDDDILFKEITPLPKEESDDTYHI